MSRPGFSIWNMAGSGSGLMEATVTVGNDYIELSAGGPGGPNEHVIIYDFHGYGWSGATFAMLIEALMMETMAFAGEVHPDAANYCLVDWLVPGGPYDCLDVVATLNMTTAWVTKNPTLPAVGNVKSGVNYGDGGSGLTGTLLVPRRSC